jgi:hypothetical protein
MSAAFQLLLPGAIVSLLIHGLLIHRLPSPGGADWILWYTLLISCNWLFYLVLCAGITKLLRRRRRKNDSRGGENHGTTQRKTV